MLNIEEIVSAYSYLGILSTCMGSHKGYGHLCLLSFISCIGLFRDLVNICNHLSMLCM